MAFELLKISYKDENYRDGALLGVFLCKRSVVYSDKINDWIKDYFNNKNKWQVDINNKQRIGEFFKEIESGVEKFIKDNDISKDNIIMEYNLNDYFREILNKEECRVLSK